MKIGTEKKLVLNRETIRSLSVQEMQNVAGGFSVTSGSSIMTSVLKSQQCGKTTNTGAGQTLPRTTRTMQ